MVSHWRRLGGALVALGIVFVAGTVGYAVLGFPLLDAAYQTVTTVATVGFREVQPLTAAGKVFTMVLILVGVGTTLYALTVLCGWGRVGRSIAHDLAVAGMPLVVIDSDAERIAACEHPAIVGDATDDDVLRAAGIERAKSLVAAVDSDASNLFVTVSARAMRPDLFIVSRVRADANEDKLLRAGADRVVNPQSIGGARMAAFVANPHVAAFIDVVMHEHDIEYRLGEVEVRTDSPLVDTVLCDAHIREKSGALVLAVRADDGRFVTNPPPDTRIHAGSVLIVIGTGDQLSALQQLASSGR